MNTNKLFDSLLHHRLKEREARGLLRSLVYAGDKIDFSSNDYLGFSQLPELKYFDSNNLPAGATGSRLITGNSLFTEETEKIIARFHRAEAALIFNTGYMANTGLISSVTTRQDTIIADEFIHASIIDGMRLSLAAHFKFRHNDLEDLEKKLQSAKGNKFVIVESVYSMDGDEAPLKEIAAICKKHNALLIVDEAHANGLFGENGEGLVVKNNLQSEVFACIYTFGKAVGLHGAAVTGSQTLRDFLINHARSFIYTTALPPHFYMQIQKAYSLLPTANRSNLFQLIDYFKSRSNALKKYKFIKSNSAIQGIIIAGNLKAKALSEYLFNKGFFVKAILSPTVPEGTERLRICLHSFNTKEEIDQLLLEINNFNS